MVTQKTQTLLCTSTKADEQQDWLCLLIMSFYSSTKRRLLTCPQYPSLWPLPKFHWTAEEDIGQGLRGPFLQGRNHFIIPDRCFSDPLLMTFDEIMRQSPENYVFSDVWLKLSLLQFFLVQLIPPPVDVKQNIFYKILDNSGGKKPQETT